MALSNFNDNLSIAAPKDIDNRRAKFFGGVWLPYANVGEANTAIVPAYRARGLTCFILQGGIATEYWYRDGIADVDLIPKLGGAGTVTADSGLNISSPNNVQLGGTLLQYTVINTTSAYSLEIDGARTSNSIGIFSVDNQAQGLAVRIDSLGRGLLVSSSNGWNAVEGSAASNGIGVVGRTASGIGIYGDGGTGIGTFGGSNSTGTGVTGMSTTGLAGEFYLNTNTSLNSVLPIVRITRKSGGGNTSNGVGGSLDFYNSHANAVLDLSNQIISKLTDATYATRTSQFIITGVNSAVTADLFTLSGSGALQLNKYNAAVTSGAAVYNLAVDASGNVITTTGAVGGGFTTADNGLTANTSTNVRLGGTLIQNTTITEGNFVLTATGTTTSPSQTQSVLNVRNTSTGGALHVEATSDYPLYVESFGGASAIFAKAPASGGTALEASGNITASVTNTNAVAIFGYSEAGVAGRFLSYSTATNTVVPSLYVERNVWGGASANNIGVSIDLKVGTTTTASTTSNQLISKWTNATDATRTSQFIITGVNSAVAADLFTLSGSGALQLNKYNAAVTSGEAVYNLAVTTADNGLTANTSTNVRLGGTLLGATTISGNGNSLSISNTSSVYALFLTNAGTGLGLSISSNAYPINATTANISPVLFQSTDNAGAAISASLLQVLNNPAGASSNNIGTIIEFGAKSSTTTSRVSNQLISKWTSITDATRTSQFIITGVNSGTTNTLMTIDGTGNIEVFGTGVAFTATHGSYGANLFATSIGLYSESTNLPVWAVYSGANSSSTVTTIAINRNGTGSVGFGSRILTDLNNASSSPVDASSLETIWTVATGGTETSQLNIKLNNAGSGTNTKLSIGGEGYMKLTPITATAASAITPAEGMILMVSSTDATFTSIGFWGYRNGAWAAF